MEWDTRIDLGHICNPRKQGDIGVAAAHLFYTKKGFTVYFPSSEATPYDIMVDTGSAMMRVQCKTSRFRPNKFSYAVMLATNGGNKSSNRRCKTIHPSGCDIVFIWCDNESLWEVPASAVEGKASITIGMKTIQWHVGGPIPNYYIPSPSRGDGSKVCGDASCDNVIERESTHCKSHAQMLRNGAAPHTATVIKWPSEAELVRKLKKSNYVQVSKQLGVSDNAIRKHLRVRGYDTKTFEKVE